MKIFYPLLDEAIFLRNWNVGSLPWNSHFKPRLEDKRVERY